jgi:Acyltransferase family
MKSGHIPALDGIRGLAVVLVLIFHFRQGCAPRNAILGSGWIGVDLFFALSGFLITESFSIVAAQLATCERSGFAAPCGSSRYTTCFSQSQEPALSPGST